MLPPPCEAPLIAPNPTPPPAVPAASTEEAPCAKCLAHGGLCRSCLRALGLGELRTNWPTWLAGVVRTEQKKRQTLGAAPTKQARKVSRKQTRKASKLARQLRGEYTKVRHAA